MNIRNIVLEGPQIASPNTSSANGWWIDGNIINVRTTHSHQRYKLPKGSAVITIQTLGNGRSTLILGGFAKSNIAITGPTLTVKTLREHIL